MHFNILRLSLLKTRWKNWFKFITFSPTCTVCLKLKNGFSQIGPRGENNLQGFTDKYYKPTFIRKQENLRKVSESLVITMTSCCEPVLVVQTDEQTNWSLWGTLISTPNCLILHMTSHWPCLIMVMVSVLFSPSYDQMVKQESSPLSHLFICFPASWVVESLSPTSFGETLEVLKLLGSS